MRSLLVTGLSGMVGTRFRELYKGQYTFENMDLSEGVDITDRGKVMDKVSASKAEVLVHLAAFTNVSAAHEQNGEKSGSCYSINVRGTENVARAVLLQGKFLIHVSTDFIFDGTKTTAYVETDEPNPIEWYGQTKLWAEDKVREILPENQYVILRISYPYQAKPVRPDFVANLVEKLKSDTLPPQFTDHTITPTFVDDIARVFDHCLRERPTGIYHCVGSSWHSDHEMAIMVKEVYDLPGEVKPGNLEAYLKTVPRPYQRTMKVSNSKLQKEMGIKMKTFREGLDLIRQGT